MRGLSNFQPLLRIRLGPEEVALDPIAKYLSPAAGQRLQPGRLHIGQDLLQWLFGDALNLGDLDHGEGLQMRGGAGLLHRLQDVEIVLVGQLGIDAADYMDLGDRGLVVLGDARGDLLGCQHVAALVFGLDVKGAELTELVADVGVIDVLVAHVVCGPAAFALADDIGQIAQDGQLVAGVQAQAVVQAQALAGQHFVVDITETGPADKIVVNHLFLPRLVHNT